MITASLNDSYKLMNTQGDNSLLMESNYKATLNTTKAATTAATTTTTAANGVYKETPDLLADQSGPSSAEETVFLPTYASLPTTKLEEEPNPFEQSFESTNIMQKPILPSVKSMDNPKPTRLDALENQWDSLRTGILSPSMLPGPTPTARRPIKYEVETTTFYNHTYDNPPPTVKHARKVSNSSSSEASFNASNKKQKTAQGDTEDEEKRKNFLERNRIAALKCRQRKKQWLQNLQTKVEYLAADNEQFHMQTNALREELINLKTLLMAHKDCPIGQQDLKIALSRPIPGVPALPHLLEKNNDD